MVKADFPAAIRYANEAGHVFLWDNYTKVRQLLVLLCAGALFRHTLFAAACVVCEYVVCVSVGIRA